MKKLIILGFGFAVASASAQSLPAIFPQVPFQRIAPNGSLAAAENNLIIDLAPDGGIYVYTDQYSNGSGNCISNNGIVVGYKTTAEKAAYWQNEQWTVLPAPDGPYASTYANGITPDGTRIVGEISPSSYGGGYEGNMLVPCYWDLLPDGTFSDPVLLPHPTKDFTGRPPQYITAVTISDDGTKIAGQVHDFSGMVNQPIVFQQDSEGNWSYTILLESLFYPEGFTIPEDPGEGPTPFDFMTPEEIASFNRALELWEMAGGDYNTYPDVYLYMTPEENEAFLEANLDWSVVSEEFYIKLNELFNAVPNFSYNNVLTDTSISTYVTTDTKGYFDEMTGLSVRDNIIYVINIEDGSYKKYPAVDDIQLIASGYTDNGCVFAQSYDGINNIFQGYVLPAGEEKFILLYDFLNAMNPELGEWMRENMTHDYEAINPDNFSTYPATALATGIPHPTPDMQYIALAIANYWDYSSSAPDTYGYILNPFGASGVKLLPTDDSSISVNPLPGAALAIKGNPSTLQIYNTNGAKVLELQNPAPVVNTSLPKGIYIVKARNEASGNYSGKLIIK